MVSLTNSTISDHISFSPLDHNFDKIAAQQLWSCLLVKSSTTPKKLNEQVFYASPTSLKIDVERERYSFLSSPFILYGKIRGNKNPASL